MFHNDFNFLFAKVKENANFKQTSTKSQNYDFWVHAATYYKMRQIWFLSLLVLYFFFFICNLRFLWDSKTFSFFILGLWKDSPSKLPLPPPSLSSARNILCLLIKYYLNLLCNQVLIIISDIHNVSLLAHYFSSSWSL